MSDNLDELTLQQTHELEYGLALLEWTAAQEFMMKHKDADLIVLSTESGLPVQAIYKFRL